MKGMTLKAMTEAVNGIYHGSSDNLENEITAVTIDSRTVCEGGLFVAIKGERSDGHDYIGQCFEKGAACVISEKELPGETHSYIQVQSSLQALKELALLYRNNLWNLLAALPKDRFPCGLRNIVFRKGLYRYHGEQHHTG